jgi:hypothetical protein
MKVTRFSSTFFLFCIPTMGLVLLMCLLSCRTSNEKQDRPVGKRAPIEDLATIQEGMTRDEIHRRIGSPTETGKDSDYIRTLIDTKKTTDLHNLYFERYSYEDGSKFVIVYHRHTQKSVTVWFFRKAIG